MTDRLVDDPDAVAVLAAQVAEAGIGALARDVCINSRAAGLPAHDRPPAGFASSPAFTGSRHTDAVTAGCVHYGADGRRRRRHA